MHQYEGYFEEIIKKQNILRAQIKQLSEDLQNMKWSQTAENMIDIAAPSIFEICNIPIATPGDMDELETFLLEQFNFNAAVRELSKIGGKSAYDFIKSAVSLMLTDELAQKYSWLGAKKKLVFGKLKLAELLQKSAETSLHIAYKESEKAIKKWLRRAKERALNKKHG